MNKIRVARMAGFSCLARLMLLLAFVLSSAAAPAQTLTTIAGNGGIKHSGDGGSALDAALEAPTDIAVDKFGNVYISESYADFQGAFRVRKITPAGIITTVAGSGLPGNDGKPPTDDGGPATAANMIPEALATDAAGNLYVFDNAHGRIRKINSGGIISTYAGGGGSSANGVAATNANLGLVRAMAFDAAGNLFYSSNNQIRKISTGGTVTTIANQSSTWGFSGDGGPALSANLADPGSLAIGADGSIYICDNHNERIRRIGPNNVITTVAGGGRYRTDPEALNVDLWDPIGVGVDSRGNVFFASAGGIWQVSPAGFSRLVNGVFCDSTFSDRCVTSSKPLVNPGQAWKDLGDLTLAGDGSIYFVDHARRRAHKISPVADMAPPEGVRAFEPFGRLPINGEADSLRIGDVTGDGRSDVAVLTARGNPNDNLADALSLLLYVQKADGTLAAPTKYRFQGHDGVDGIVMTDFNRDGIRDLVVGVSYPGALAVFDGNAAGALSPRLLAVDGNAGRPEALDVNLDGIVDVVGTGYGYVNGLWVAVLRTFIGDGAGGVTQQSMQATSVEASYMGKGDFNSDGLDDLALVGRGGVELLLHDPHGGFLPRQWIPPPLPGNNYAAGSVGDFNHDGRDDLTFATSGNDPVWLYQYTQDKNGKLEGPRAYFTYDGPDAAAAGDINGDGLDDMVVVHTGWQSIGLYQQTLGGLATEAKYLLPPYSSWHRINSVDTGDLDSDGCRDVAVADYNWSLVLYYGQNCIKPASAATDLDADGKADLVWRDRAGVAHAWKQGQKTSPQPLTAAAGWNVLAAGDFNGDGHGDLFWRNCVNGANRLSGGDGRSIRSASTISDRAWQLLGSGDLDGDGSTDLVWRRSNSSLAVIWPGGDGRRERRLAGVPGPQWDLADIGDYDGDGKADLFWRQRQTGATQTWSRGDVARAKHGARAMDTDWQLAGSGDIDGDGRADLVWRHARTGANLVWKAGDYARREALDVVADPNWRIVSIDDYDGDRRADLFWHNAATGVNVIWKAAQSQTRIMSATERGAFAVVTGAQSCALAMPAARTLPRADAGRIRIQR